MPAVQASSMLAALVEGLRQCLLLWLAVRRPWSRCTSLVLAGTTAACYLLTALPPHRRMSMRCPLSRAGSRP